MPADPPSPLPRSIEAIDPRGVPDLVSLALLRAIGEEHSLSRAAALIGLSQPAASARLRQLERQVGVPLAERSPRGSRLTDEGALVAGWADSVLSASAELSAGVASLRADASARLRLAASLTVAEHLLPTWLAQFATRHPHTTVTLDAVNSDRVERAVADGTVDLGFVEGPVVSSELKTRVVARDRLVVVVAPQHPWASRRTPVPAAELGATRLVQREPTSGTRASLEAALVSAGVTEFAQPVLELSSTSAVRSAASAGAGPAVLSTLAVAADVAAGRLVEVEVDVDLRRVLRAVWRPSNAPAGPAIDLLTLVTGRG